MTKLEEHGPYTVHVIGPEPYSCKGDEIEGQKDLPCMYKNVFFVFPGTDLLPEFIEKKSQPVQSSPDYEFHVCSMPQATQKHSDHQVDVRPEFAFAVSADGNVQVILQP